MPTQTLNSQSKRITRLKGPLTSTSVDGKTGALSSMGKPDDVKTLLNPPGTVATAPGG